jgi:hypothetical protein
VPVGGEERLLALSMQRDRTVSHHTDLGWDLRTHSAVNVNVLAAGAHRHGKRVSLE